MAEPIARDEDDSWLYKPGTQVPPGLFDERTDLGQSILPPEAHGILTKEQAEQYERDGYVVVRKLFSEEELQVWRNRFEDLCNGVVEAPSSMLIMRDVALAKALPKGTKNMSNVTKIQDFQEDPVMFSFAQHPKLTRYVQAFCGENVRSIHSMLINKPPDLGKGTSRHPMHQDLYYFPLRSCNRIVGTWVAMEEKIDRRNGCLSVIPGSHLSGMLEPHENPEWENNALYHGIQSGVDFDKRVHLEMEKGDCVFFHPLLFHGSGRNETSGFRKAISVHFASGKCIFNPIAEELVRDGFKHRLSLPADKIPYALKQKLFREAWRTKSRQVVGEELPHWIPNPRVQEEFFQFLEKYFEDQDRAKQ